MIRQQGQRENPRHQSYNTPDGGLVIIDPRTGATQSYGTTPQHQGDPDRSTERISRDALKWGAAAAAAVALVVVLNKGGK